MTIEVPMSVRVVHRCRRPHAGTVGARVLGVGPQMPVRISCALIGSERLKEIKYVTARWNVSHLVKELEAKNCRRIPPASDTVAEISLPTLQDPGIRPISINRLGDIHRPGEPGPRA